MSVVIPLQVKNLQQEIANLKREESDTPKTITADLEELRRMLLCIAVIKPGFERTKKYPTMYCCYISGEVERCLSVFEE